MAQESVDRVAISHYPAQPVGTRLVEKLYQAAARQEARWRNARLQDDFSSRVVAATLRHLDRRGYPLSPQADPTLERKALGYLTGGGDARAIMDAARLLVFFKGNDSHDYKFSSALLEDFAHVSPEWRGRLLASGMMSFKGSGAKDLDLVKRTRAAFKG